MPSTPRPARLTLATLTLLLGTILSSGLASSLASAQVYGGAAPYAGRSVASPLPPTEMIQARMRVEDWGPPPPDRSEAILRQRLYNELAARRAQNVQRFIQYRDAASFPRNHVQAGMLNVFIDSEGHICAAANLMAHDGMLPVVQQVAAQNNYLRLADVHDGPLYRWMLSSGFTQAEIAMIQEPYDYIEPGVVTEPDRELEEAVRLQARFTEVLGMLIQQAPSALLQAVETLIAYRQSHGISIHASVAAQGDMIPSQPIATPVVVSPPPSPIIVVPAPQPVVQPIVQPVYQPVAVYQPYAPGGVPSALVLDASPPGQRVVWAGPQAGTQTVQVQVRVR